MKKTNTKGFTLIELLAVIVIIAIIALIGIPSVTKIMSNSRKDAIKSTGLAMVKAAKTFIASENITPPTGSENFVDPTTTVTGGCWISWDQLGMDSSKLATGNPIEPSDSTGTPDPAGSKVVVYDSGSDVYVYLVDLVDDQGFGLTAKSNDDLTTGGETLRTATILSGTGPTLTDVSTNTVPLCTSL